MERFCYRCKRDEKFQRTQDGEDGCPIVLASMSFNPGDEGYPPEWITKGVFVEDAKCTAFDPIEGGSG